MSSTWSIVGTEFVQVWGGTRSGCALDLRMLGLSISCHVFGAVRRLAETHRTCVRSTLTSWLDAPGYLLRESREIYQSPACIYSQKERLVVSSTFSCAGSPTVCKYKKWAHCN